ncbi:MAG: cobalamin-independent methionine synthase II family protein [Bryobacteraceae bacterium]|jgi:5-methyltetrahydropteroyltriglutamate--homocysteine methyltransferase
MKTSVDRILTTHVGSLPRPQNVVDFLFAEDRGEPYDRTQYDDTMRQAVALTVTRQTESGVDIVSDGEMSKIGYATYIRHRLTGFALGTVPRATPQDLDDVPAFRDKLVAEGHSPKYLRPICKGPIAVRNLEPLHKDIANLKRAVAQAGAVEGFMNAASPGTIAVFQPNEYYATYQAYLEALANAMRTEYETIINAGLILQIDCPDLAMGRHIKFRGTPDEEFVRNAEMQVEAMNHALANVPADRVRFHVCWGNYEGPHTHDIPLEKILPTLLKAKPMAILIEGANPRHEHEWEIWEKQKFPDDKVLIPGVIDTSCNFVEHPRLVAQRLIRYAKLVGRERVIAGTDCGFGTFAGFGPVHPDICWLKLKSLREGADLASGELWGRAHAAD